MSEPVLVWPFVGLDVEGLRSGGRKALPFVEFVLKIHSRCNLACDYCYMYEMVDQNWLRQPKVMSDEIFQTSCEMIREHVEKFAVSDVIVHFHGGEPLLVGHERFAHFASVARQTVGTATRLHLSVQTNGLLLDERYLAICDQYGIGIGVSLDGNQEGNDRHRRSRSGAGSYQRVAERLAMMLDGAHRRCYTGLLCTIDVDNDPVATYESLLTFKPPGVDFLLPHGNWVSLPRTKEADPDSAVYGDWLVEVFDRWYGAPVLETRVRLFDRIMDQLLGRLSSSETIGLQPVRVAVIETDGTIEQSDALKSAYQGATAIALSGHGNPLDEAMWSAPIVARQIGIEALSETCRACDLRTVCGGGQYTHRYHEESGFRTRSVYCADLQRLIRHIESRLRAELIANYDPAKRNVDD